MSLPNLIVSINNASRVQKSTICVKPFKNLLNYLEIIRNKSLILGYSKKSKKKVQIFLNYYKGGPVISNYKNISKPSSKIYISIKDLYKYRRSMGLIILSTSQGLICHQEALKKGIGGKVLSFYI